MKYAKDDLLHELIKEIDHLYIRITAPIFLAEEEVLTPQGRGVLDRISASLKRAATDDFEKAPRLDRPIAE